MDQQPEFSEKRRRVQTMLVDLGYDSFVITRRSNFAWFTCGGEAVSSRVSRTSPVYLVITPERIYAVGYYMDLPSTMARVLGNLGVEVDVESVCLPTFGPTIEETVLKLVVGKAAADDDGLGFDNIQNELVKRHEPLTAPEMARYRQLGEAAGFMQKELATWVQPGMTERDVLAHMWYLALQQGMEGHYMFVGSDEHIAQYRHPVPTDKRIEKAVLIAPAVAKWGLLVATSRLVYFEPPPEDVRRRFWVVAYMQALLLANTRLGTPLRHLFDLIWSQLEAQGYGEERFNHFHGGPIGYWDSYASRMQDPNETVQPNMAFTYYLTIAGVKSEELILVDNTSAQLVSVDPDWPRLDFQVNGMTVETPDILVRS